MTSPATFESSFAWFRGQPSAVQDLILHYYSLYATGARCDTASRSQRPCAHECFTFAAVLVAKLLQGEPRFGHN